MKRLGIVAVAAVLVAAVAAYALTRNNGDGASFDAAKAPTLEEMADRLGSDVMQLLHAGNVPKRTGEILLVPKPHFYLGPEASLETYETAQPNTFTSHPNPWSYLARVPLIVYAPGRVQPGRFGNEVDLTALAPTYARMLGLEDFKADGRPLPRGIDYDRPPPRLIFTIVIDGGGWNVLQAFPQSWPNVRSLARGSALYDNANIGSFPAQTGAIHGNIGTGSYPRTHGIAYNLYFEQADPRYLEVPTIGDVWDRATGNRAVVGTISVLANHLAMLGHGAGMSGADHDIGVIWDDEKQRWTTNERFYSLPDYIANVDYDRLERYERALDDRDGLRDGRWFANTIPSLREGLKRSSNPAFERYQGDDVLEVIEREGLGQDAVTDLFYVQFKSPDQGGHIWNMVRPEIGDILAEADAQIARIKQTLDARVGAGNYVLVITADHGQQPLAQASGGWMINSEEVARDVQAAFDIEARVRSHQLNIADDADVDIADVARFLGTYTIGDNIPEGIPGEFRVGKARRRELVFAGAFPTSYLERLSSEDIAEFGDSRWRAGRLTIDRSKASG